MIKLIFIITLAMMMPSLLTGIDTEGTKSRNDNEYIRPYEQNPFYWQYKGKPILLIGASNDDNLFQWTSDSLTGHLNLLVSAGGNYVRNTMSDRDKGNVYAFKEINHGIYDLDQWNEAYWDRLKFFLDETIRRGIMVQLTLWDQFDFRNRAHPWYNNINITGNVLKNRDDFFNTVKINHEEGLHFQHRFIDKLLSVTLVYDHILYNINNESSEGEIWENYWAQYIHQKASELNRTAYVTTLQLDPTNSVRTAMTHRNLYSYVEISQNNQDSRGARGPAHYATILEWRRKLQANPMPMNNEKIYGAVDGINYSAGTETEAINRLWRNIFAGCASARIHRPAEPHMWGAGLNERVQTNLKAVNMLMEEFNIFQSNPHNDLLSSYVAASSESMEAYCMARIGKQYAVFFPSGRFTIDLDPWVFVDKMRVKWLDIDENKWIEEILVQVHWEGGLTEWGSRGRVRLTTPGNKSYVVLIEVVEH